jgi:hypothetical protein
VTILEHTERLLALLAGVAVVRLVSLQMPYAASLPPASKKTPDAREAQERRVYQLRRCNPQ